MIDTPKKKLANHLQGPSFAPDVITLNASAKSGPKSERRDKQCACFHNNQIKPKNNA